MHVTARSDYALRAMLELAATESGTATRSRLAEAQGIPTKFLETILTDLRRARLLDAQRGAQGGYRLARSADAITVADVVRAVEGPLAAVRGLPPEQIEYSGAAQGMREVWIAVRASLRHVLEGITLADVLAGHLPVGLDELLDEPGSWVRR